MSIEIRGVEDMGKRLEKLIATENLEKALAQACFIVERSAKQKAPKGDGDLRRSISSRVEGTEGLVYTNLEYAPYVEYGTGLFAENGGRTQVPWRYKDEYGEWHSTSGMKPRPYMRPALDENREDIIRTVKEGLTSD